MSLVGAFRSQVGTGSFIDFLATSSALYQASAESRFFLDLDKAIQV